MWNSARYGNGWRVGMAAALLAGCSDRSMEVHVSQQRTDVSGSSLAIRATDPETGENLAVDSVTVELQGADGTWHTVSHRERDGSEARLDVALVADNSGSQKAMLETIRAATRQFGVRLLDLGDEGRVSVVRVSTESSIVSELSSDVSAVEDAAQGMFTNAGWTALYDGLRLGNETLARGWEESETDPCATPVFRGILTFTNGADNNSSDQQLTKYAGDGVNTTVDDLLTMDVHGAQTPIFAVGIGKDVDEKTLRTLSESTGGLYAAVDDYQGLGDALSKAAEQVWAGKLICIPPVELPAGCDGVAGSGKELDACGVCGGDGNGCKGCDGVPNSGKTFDACGVCGGNGSSCAGCDGIALSGKVYDDCGVCGGNGASCTGCDGKAYSGKTVDACGVCGGNNACVGCDGVKLSGKKWDACGVCGGNGVCAVKCAGNSGKRIDACGKCGGDGSSCAGCDGKPNSGKVFDTCGVCGGDGSSCKGCDGVAKSGKVYDDCGVCNGNNSTCMSVDGSGVGSEECPDGSGNNGNDKCVGKGKENSGKTSIGGGQARVTVTSGDVQTTVYVDL